MFLLIFRVAFFVFSVECSPGTYYDEDEATCILCEVGSYQPLPAQSICLICPDNMTTYGRGAVHRRECCKWTFHNIFEFFRFRPVNQFSEFREFLLDSWEEMTTYTDAMCHLCELTIYDKLFFTHLVEMTHMRLDNLTIQFIIWHVLYFSSNV